MKTDRDDIPPELHEALKEGESGDAGLRAIWDALGSVRTPGPIAPSTPDAWADLERRISRRPTPSEPPSPTERRSGRAAPDRPARETSRRSRLVPAGLAVGALVLVVALGFVWWTQPVVVSVASGDQQTVTLPDGSTVELNSDSRLAYTRGFERVPFLPAPTREVALAGEAFFSITRDAQRPFVVRTGDARIEVLGTQFNVRARDTERGRRTLVTLREGTIRVRAEGEVSEPVVLDSSGASVMLRAGEAPQMMARQTSLEHVLAWRSRGFAAVDEPVGDILREIQRRYSVELELERGLSTDSAMTVFYLRGTSAEEIIHDLCLSRGWNYRETSRGFAVFASGRRGGAVNVD